MPGRQRRKATEKAGSSTSKNVHSSWSWVTIVCASIVVLLSWKLFGSQVGLTKHVEIFPVCDRVLAVEATYGEILQMGSRSSSNPTHKCFNASILGYVTPWNPKGYDMAKKYRTKFTHISPVWYQLKRDMESLSLKGKHDVDQAWISQVRQGGSPLIVPRVVIEGWPLQNMLLEGAERKHAINLIVDECHQMKYDGIVLEAWNSWAAYKILANKKLRQKALEFVRELGASLHENSGKQLLFAIPPARGDSGPEEFKQSDLMFLQHAVDAFSLMTYDYSNAYNPGPNAPIQWIKASLKSLLSGSKLASKVLMGINFYGNDFVIPQGGGAIVGDKFMKLLEQHKPQLKWDSTSGEHYMMYYCAKDESMHKVYYPTLQSIGLRLKEAAYAGVGISIWEIGQGLDYFFDIL